MKTNAVSRLIIRGMLLVAACTTRILSQTSPFEVAAYKEYLSAHQNLTTNQLLQLHPAGTFRSKVNLDSASVGYLDTIARKYGMTQGEYALLLDHGFMVSERLRTSSFGRAYLDIWQKDLPVYISSDAILHAVHLSYDRILTDVELGLLIPKLDTLLAKLHSSLPALTASYAGDSAMVRSLRDVDLYVTIPRRLLGSVVSPYFAENEMEMTDLINLIQSEAPASYPIFAKTPRDIDFSQFRPRGHYTNGDFPQLARYFEAMMWLGRIELYLIPPRSVGIPPTEQDIKRQTIDAALILEAARSTDALPLLAQLDTMIQFFVGEPDNVTLPNVQELAGAARITSANQLEVDSTFHRFQDTLRTKSYAFQRILSQILFNDPCNPDSIVPASAFLLLGQRFIIDSYISEDVVFDKIVYNGFRVPRMLPSTLDVLFGLGNDAAAQLLQHELDQYDYGTNLAGVRYLVDHYEPEFWSSSLFNLWLDAIRTLNPPHDRDSLPPYMQTGAWWQEKMTTQLASWAELRHDNLLYAKESYTGGVATCSYPHAYAEPAPDFYRAIARFAGAAEDRFAAVDFPDPDERWRIVDYCARVKGIADRLTAIAEKELGTITLADSEQLFLKSMMYEGSSCAGTYYSGWYSRLFYGEDGSGNQVLKSDAVVADIHTSPIDEKGNPVGWVLHAGTGAVDLGVFITDLPSHGAMASVGPVSSYHEYVTTNFLRLTDEEWKSSYLASSARPSFVNLYLADSSGNGRGEGANLLTTVRELPAPAMPSASLLRQNFPNPFNGSTIISFSIPPDLAHARTDLAVYNIQGRLVKRLLGETLPAQTYLIRWDGSDQNGNQVTSGTYLYRLIVGTNSQSGKIAFIK